MASTAVMDSGANNTVDTNSLDSEVSEEPEYELERVDPVVGRIEPARRAVHWMPSMILDKVGL